jgi:lauroyl/myristoyl acyltransferase
MSTSAHATQDLLAGIAEPRRAQYFRGWLKDFSKEFSTKREKIAQFREWLEQLSDEAITTSYQQHYNPTYLNLLSVFGEELPNEKIHSLTIECIKTKLWNECEYYFHLSHLIESIKSGQHGKEFATEKSLLRLSGWDTGLIHSLLSQGRGLIICSFRFGAIRDVPLELALLGFPILEAVNTPTYEAMQAAFASLADCGNETILPPEKHTPRAENIRLLKTVNAEDVRCTVQLVEALKRRNIIGICVEGNTGSDGPWGDTSKSRINFLGHTLLVKNGAARLAAALRAPILPLVALKDGDTSGHLLFNEPIIPPAGLKRSENEEFVRASMQTLYSLLESYVRRDPAQWEGWSALHRWRERHDVTANEKDSTNVDPKQIGELLHQGKKFRINQRRVALLPTKDGVMWVDLKTLNGFQNPKWAAPENILASLSKPEGLDLTWVESTSRDVLWKERICSLLAYLQESDLVSAY